MKHPSIFVFAICAASIISNIALAENGVGQVALFNFQVKDNDPSTVTDCFTVGLGKSCERMVNGGSIIDNQLKAPGVVAPQAVAAHGVVSEGKYMQYGKDSGTSEDITTGSDSQLLFPTQDKTTESNPGSELLWNLSLQNYPQN